MAIEEHDESTERVLAQLLAGASKEIKIFASLSKGDAINPVLGSRLLEVAALAHSAVARKCLLHVSEEFGDSSPGPLGLALRSFGNSDFEVRASPFRSPMSLLLVDGEHAWLEPSDSQSHSAAVRLSSKSSVVEALDAHFETIWASAYDPAKREAIEPLYEDLLASSVPDQAKRIIVASQAALDSLIRRLHDQPFRLHSLSPREFEELVCTLLLRDGFDARLTPPVRDGGRDILAYIDSPVGRHLYLVECKRYASDNPVGVSMVRALYGVVMRERATAGLLVTTSTFTKGAFDFQRDVKHQLSLKDYKGVVQWIRNGIGPV